MHTVVGLADLLPEYHELSQGQRGASFHFGLEDVAGVGLFDLRADDSLVGWGEVLQVAATLAEEDGADLSAAGLDSPFLAGSLANRVGGLGESQPLVYCGDAQRGSQH